MYISLIFDNFIKLLMKNKCFYKQNVIILIKLSKINVNLYILLSFISVWVWQYIDIVGYKTVL